MILDLEKCYGAWWWRKDKKRECDHGREIGQLENHLKN